MDSADEPAEGHRHPLAKGASPEAIAAALLPEDGAARFAELRAALELDPWSGEHYVRTNPLSAMRTRTFAAPSGDGPSPFWPNGRVRTPAPGWTAGTARRWRSDTTARPATSRAAPGLRERFVIRHRRAGQAFRGATGLGRSNRLRFAELGRAAYHRGG